MRIDVQFTEILVYILVLVRLSGMILLNPILGRTNIPMLVRMGLVFTLTLLLAPAQVATALPNMQELELFMAVLKELFIGVVYGYIFQIFYYLLFFAGEMMDTDFGISMAKNFDPSTNIQSTFSSSLLSILFICYFFASGSHLALVRIYASSFSTFPVGIGGMNSGILSFVMELFTMVFLLALRLLLPFMAAEFALQFAMGMLMRFIPQISVFVINFQLKILLGILLLFIFAPFIGQFLDTYLVALLDSLATVGELLPA